MARIFRCDGDDCRTLTEDAGLRGWITVEDHPEKPWEARRWHFCCWGCLKAWASDAYGGAKAPEREEQKP